MCLSAIGQGCQEAAGIFSQTLSLCRWQELDAGFRMDVATEAKAVEVRPGDVLWGGLRLTHSLIGEFATRVEGYIHREASGAGLTHLQDADREARTGPRTRRLERSRPDAEALQSQQITRLAHEAWRWLDGQMAAVAQLPGVPFQLEDLENYLVQSNVKSAVVFRSVKAAWQEEGSEPTAYGALNAMMRAAMHDENLTDSQRENLDKLAGIFAARQGRICSHCRSVRKSTVKESER